ncbi:hypothetical protein A2801_00080 [Candidatus Woesebacteria bacterium RIFCSPHIGHO2_01_FULL_41_10]|uniref:Uncharacterized protein n=1 Tax=Candidatus Woesebacteria bacterium RIFCSPHIGHO2_01_FULL_41_10 TaxID=1802500 RepID=A0A1F7YRA5_9BACT|nr:MAG: hypothetical protein A2801_00080 [Candidatus Woesebacteria bacterium RIFCSPHIGHO2_01_FULL_41_10]
MSDKPRQRGSTVITVGVPTKIEYVGFHPETSVTISCAVVPNTEKRQWPLVPAIMQGKVVIADRNGHVSLNLALTEAELATAGKKKRDRSKWVAVLMVCGEYICDDSIGRGEHRTPITLYTRIPIALN